MKELQLKRVTRDDAEALLALFSCEPVFRYICDGEAPGREVIDAWIERSDALFDAHGVGLFLAYDDEVFIGMTGFFEFFEPPVLEFLFAIHPDHFRKGYSEQMVRASLALALDIDPVHASTDAPNVASLRALARAGFKEVSREGATVHFELHRSQLSMD